MEVIWCLLDWTKLVTHELIRKPQKCDRTKWSRQEIKLSSLFVQLMRFSGTYSKIYDGGLCKAWTRLPIHLSGTMHLPSIWSLFAIEKLHNVYCAIWNAPFIKRIFAIEEFAQYTMCNFHFAIGEVAHPLWANNTNWSSLIGLALHWMVLVFNWGL